MQNYFAIVTCRNSEKSIEKALLSLKNQSLPPEYTIVVDDGSSDNTPTILKKLKEQWDTLYVLTRKDEGYDIKRVVKNWNSAIQLSKSKNFHHTVYHLIATDDTIYEKRYCEKVILYLEKNPNIAIASGTYCTSPPKMPHGAGRFVRNDFIDNSEWNGFYPEKMGYESAILYEAERCGFTHRVIFDAKFEHIRELGKNHKFYEFGASMQTLGYHPLYAFGRFIKYFVTGEITGRLGSLYMFYYYLSYKPKQIGYDSMYDENLRKYIRNRQYKSIKKFIMNLVKS